MQNRAGQQVCKDFFPFCFCFGRKLTADRAGNLKKVSCFFSAQNEVEKRHPINQLLKGWTRNTVWFSNALTHPHDKSGGFQFIQRTLDRHGAARQDCKTGFDPSVPDRTFFDFSLLDLLVFNRAGFPCSGSSGRKSMRERRPFAFSESDLSRR